MKITNHNVLIRLDDLVKSRLSCHLPRFDFLTLDFSKAAIIIKIDDKEITLPWKMNEGRIMWLLVKSGHATNDQIYTRAKIIEGEIVISDFMKVMVYSLSFSCTNEEIMSETEWEKKERLEMEKIRKCFPEN